MSASGLRSTEDVLQTIGRLSPEDRRWILNNLPPDARARLAALTSNYPHAEEATAAGFGAEAVATLQACSPKQMAAALNGEPAWLVHSVAFARPWSWRKDLLQRLPATVRLEVSRLERARTRLAPAAGEFLLRALAQRVATAPQTDTAAATDSRFESLLRRFGRGDL